MTGEVLVHLLLRSEIKLIPLHRHSVSIGSEFSGRDAEEDVLHLGVFAVDVVGIARRDQGDTDSVGNVDRAGHLLALDLELVVHDLDEESIFEDPREPLRYLDGILDGPVGVVSLENSAREFAGDAAAQADDSLAVTLKDLFVDTGFEVEPFEACRRRKTD